MVLLVHFGVLLGPERGIAYNKILFGLYSFTQLDFNFIVIVSSTVLLLRSLMGPTSQFLGLTRPY